MITQNEQLDPSIVALTKAIGHQESGGDYNKVGDNGHSVGAYQWNNPTPLSKGQIPKNFASYAHDVGADGNDFSPANQDRVAYKTVEKWGKSGLTPAQIASKWNSGSPDTYKTAKPGYNSQQGVNYDVGAYVNNVAKYYKEFQGQGSDSNSNNTDLTKDKIIAPDNNTNTPDNNLKAGSGEGLAHDVLDKTADVIGGGAMARGAGYGISNALGTQDNLIKAQDQGSEIETHLIQQIQKDKARGKDTTKLIAALKALGGSLQQQGNESSDVGTGGITNKDVIGSAEHLATTAGTAYAGGLIGDLVKGGSVLENPAIKTAMSKFNMPMEEFQSLSNAEKLDALTEAVKTSSTSDRLVLQKAIQAITPSVEKELGIATFSQKFPMLAKGGGLLGGLLKKSAEYAIPLGLGAEAANLYKTLTK